MREAPTGVVSVAEVLAYMKQDRYLSLSEAVEYLSLSERTIRELLPGIPHFRVGKKLLFKLSLLDKWMQEHQEYQKGAGRQPEDFDRMAGEAWEEIGGRGA